MYQEEIAMTVETIKTAAHLTPLAYVCVCVCVCVYVHPP